MHLHINCSIDEDYYNVKVIRYDEKKIIMYLLNIFKGYFDSVAKKEIF